VGAKTLWFGKVQVASSWWIALLCFFCVFCGVASVFRIARYAPRDWTGRGGLVAHFGLAMALVGLIASRGYERKAEAVFNEAYPTEFFGRQARSVGKTSSLTDRNNKVRVQVVDQGRSVEVRPSLYYIVEGKTPAPMKWPYLEGDGLSDFYYVVHELVTEATNPMKMQKGQVGTFKGIAIKFDGYRMVGEAGQQGTQFVADMSVDKMGGMVKVSPSITIDGGGVKRTDVSLTDNLKLRLVGIDAGDKSATIQIVFAQPAYPAEVFYKPLARLVWWGVGIMGLGGLLAAWARRATRSRPSAPIEESPSDAIEPVAQV
jgi:cytochrome c biogenesis factor